MKIGPAIKAVRNHFGISQEELSNRAGVSQTTISQIENGLKHPSKPTIEIICKTLQIPEAVIYILGIDESDVPENHKEAFEKLFPQIKEFAEQIIGNRKSLISNK